MSHSKGSGLLFESGQPGTEISYFLPELRDVIAQLSDGSFRARELGRLRSIGGQERSLALVAHRESFGLELPDGVARHGHRDAIRLPQLRQARQLAGISELAVRDSASEIFRHLLVGGLASPLDHLRPKVRRCHCLIVPKPHRENQHGPAPCSRPT